MVKVMPILLGLIPLVSIIVGGLFISFVLDLCRNCTAAYGGLVFLVVVLFLLVGAALVTSLVMLLCADSESRYSVVDDYHDGTPGSGFVGIFFNKIYYRTVLILLIIVTIIALIILIAYGAVFGGGPSLNTRIYSPLLNSSVEIVRDIYDVVHVTAINEWDLFFGQGFAQAQDRLFQIDLQRRITQGRVSEVAGGSALSIDKTLLNFGLYEAAKNAVPFINGTTLNIIQAFCAGVNYYISSGQPLPFEFTILSYKPAPLEIADVIAWAKMISLNLAGNLGSELDRFKMFDAGLSDETIEDLYPLYPKDAQTILQAEDMPQYNASVDPNAVPLALEIDRLRQFRIGVGKKRYFARPNQKKAAKEEERSLWQKLMQVDSAAEAISKLLPTQALTRASNNWVLHGNKTASGKPLLCNDPHLGMTAPSIWTMYHLRSGDLDVTGASFVGTPGIIIGRNKKIAWAVTNAATDVQDLYYMNQVNETGYMYKGAYTPYEIRDLEIPVSGGKSVSFPVKHTVYGPLLTEDAFGVVEPIALHWPTLYLANDTTIVTMMEIMRAENWTMFRDSFAYFVGPGQNFIYADVEGNIGYQLPGFTPLRVANHTGTFPVPGDGNYDWLGSLDFSGLPSVFNPKSGFISSANEKVVPNTYPYLILNDRDWSEPYRGARIREFLLSKEKLTNDDMRALHGDQMSGGFLASKALLALLPDLTGAVLEARDMLLAWDGNSSITSKEATVYNFWSFTMRQRLATSKNISGVENWVTVFAAYSGDLPRLCSENCPQTAASILDEAVQNASGRQWGKAHYSYQTHQLLGSSALGCLVNRRVAVGGDGTTVNVAAGVKLNERSLMTTHGPSYRQLVDFEDLDGKSRMIFPPGQSANPVKERAIEYLQKWADVEYVPMSLSSSYQPLYTTTIEKST